MAVSHESAEGMFARDCTPHLSAQTNNKLFVDASTVEIITHIPSRLGFETLSLFRTKKNS